MELSTTFVFSRLFQVKPQVNAPLEFAVLLPVATCQNEDDPTHRPGLSGLTTINLQYCACGATRLELAEHLQCAGGRSGDRYTSQHRRPVW